MKLNINDYDISFMLKEEFINILEINNKFLFSKIISDLNDLINKDIDNNQISFFINDELNNISKIASIYIDFFNIDINSKKNINKIYDLINSDIDINENNNLQLLLQDIIKLYNKYISNIDIDLTYNDDITFVDLCKLLKVKIDDKSSNLLEKIMLLIDVESELRVNKILIFVNLKIYLSKEELTILYDYILGKKVNVLLIENISDLDKIGIENKFIIDNDFDII